MTDSEEKKRRTFAIPESREGESGADWFTDNAVPVLFRFAEYCIVSGFFMYAGRKTGNPIIEWFGYVLHACIYFYFMKYWTRFIRILTFKRKWMMIVAFVTLLFVSFILLFVVMLTVRDIASAQLIGA